MKHLILISLLFSSFMTCGQSKSKQKLQIDHVILVIKDLDLGIQQFEHMTGIKAEYGGEHSNSYTQNAIIALPNKMYIEILAPKNDLDTIPEFFKTIDKLKPIGFALASNDIEQLESKIKELDFGTKGVEDWSRTKPDGSILKWKLLQVNEPNLDINPFFISWSHDTQHPAAQKEIKASLEVLNFSTPHEEAVNQLFSSCKVSVPLLEIEESNTTRISITIKTPNGKITF